MLMPDVSILAVIQEWGKKQSQFLDIRLLRGVVAFNMKASIVTIPDRI